MARCRVVGLWQGLTALLCRRFVRGLPVSSASLPEELLAAVVAEPVPGAVQYILHTKVWGCVWDSVTRAVCGTPSMSTSPGLCMGPHPCAPGSVCDPSLSPWVYRTLFPSLGYVRPHPRGFCKSLSPGVHVAPSLS